MLELAERAAAADGNRVPLLGHVARVVGVIALGYFVVLFVLGVLDVAVDRDHDRVPHLGGYDGAPEGLFDGLFNRICSLGCHIT